MARHIIDLSIAIASGLPSDPEMMIPRIDYGLATTPDNVEQLIRITLL